MRRRPKVQKCCLFGNKSEKERKLFPSVKKRFLPVFQAVIFASSSIFFKANKSLVEAKSTLFCGAKATKPGGWCRLPSELCKRVAGICGKLFSGFYQQEFVTNVSSIAWQFLLQVEWGWRKLSFKTSTVSSTVGLKRWDERATNANATRRKIYQLSIK